VNRELRHTAVRRQRVPAAVSLMVPRSLATALLMVAGIWLSDAFHWRNEFSLPVTAGLLLVSWFGWLRGHSRTEVVCLMLALMGLGASLWTIRIDADGASDIALQAEQNQAGGDTTVRLVATVASIPSLDSVADLRSISGFNQQPRTLFLAHAQFLKAHDQAVRVRGLCRVLVEGDATSFLNWGDQVELTGQLDLAKPPLNPGEFDYARHLARNGISAMIFLKHAAAARVVEPVCWWNPALWLTSFRQQTVALLETQLSARNRAAAEALLLGNRGHLTPDLERDFILSGTMHLLAISGLHVGILYVFLLRILNLLLIPRTRALLIAGLVCLLYALLTDLRPSVTRATVFILLHIVGQMFCRDLTMGSLIGATAVILILFDPSTAFDIGAWLSFLAVGALGWVSAQSPAPQDRPAPPDSATWRDRFQDGRRWLEGWLRLSYRQMIAVTVLSAPLVATQFHLVSLIGMGINILLIPFTTLTLIAGYLFVAIGLALPAAAMIPGWLFEWMLTALNAAVGYAADIRFGFVSIPDLPSWFLPAYYVLLVCSAMASTHVVRQGLRLTLLTLVTAMFWQTCQKPERSGLTCTVLSVGHGNAVVVETPDNRVLLFDAGAMNRGARTTDLICRFLWHRGHRMIDAIIISHPDMDHYNAASGLLKRIPVGQVIMTTEFAQSKAAEVSQVLATLDSLSIPASLVTNGDFIRNGDFEVQFLKSSIIDADGSRDNETSLVAILSWRGTRICLPGDLEGEGQRELMTELSACQFLMSPHHGSLNSNTPEFSQLLKPEFVAVSARNDKVRTALSEVYADAQVYFTSRSGAVSLHVRPTGEVAVRPFLNAELESPRE
jgi:competence protein ComEC